jgi:hypothetical protein
MVRFDFLRTVLIVTFALTPSNEILADTFSAARRAHDAAINELEHCKNSRFQAGRENALRAINDQGTFLATTLNPISKNAKERISFLAEVTEALRICTNITYPKS